MEPVDKKNKRHAALAREPTADDGSKRNWASKTEADRQQHPEGQQEAERRASDDRPDRRHDDNCRPEQEYGAGSEAPDQVSSQGHGQAIAQHAGSDDAGKQASAESEVSRHGQEKWPDAQSHAGREQGQQSGGCNNIPAEVPVLNSPSVQ